MDNLFLEAAERMLVGLETQATAAHVADRRPVRVTRFSGGYLYQELGASINAITRERAVELLAAAKADSDAFNEREIGNLRHRGE